MNRLVILGTSGNADDILDIIAAINAVDPGTWKVIGALDDRLVPNVNQTELPILGPISAAVSLPDCWFINAIGSDRSYRDLPALLAHIQLPTERYATLIHPRAAISPRSVIGRGVYVHSGASVAARVVVADQIKITANVTIGHDSVIGTGAVLAPGCIIGGGTLIEPYCYIGAGAVIRQGLTIGQGALVGQGAVVVKPVVPHSVVAGNPARLLRKFE